MKPNAFVLKMYIGKDIAAKGVASDEIIIGWSKAKGLLDKNLDRNSFREILYRTYAEPNDNYRAAGGWAGSMWRFIREMSIGDYVVVPSGNRFYIAQVAGEARYEEDFVKDDTAHRRTVKWLNGGKAIPRQYARAALQSRMKARQACVGASDLVDEINEVLKLISAGEKPDFSSDLRHLLIEKTKEELYSGRLDSYGFEKLALSTIKSLGGKQAKIISRNKDTGADITADFYVAETFNLKLAVQAKHYQPDPPVEKQDLEQLVEGMQAEEAHMGWLITTGVFSDEVLDFHIEMKDQGYNIELIDGEQLATLIVEKGLSATGFLEDSDAH